MTRLSRITKWENVHRFFHVYVKRRTDRHFLMNAFALFIFLKIDFD
jgi:hypothetical protein